MKISSNRNIRNIIKDGKAYKDILLNFVFFYLKKKKETIKLSLNESLAR